MNDTGGRYGETEKGRGKINGADSTPLPLGGNAGENRTTATGDPKQTIPGAVGELASRGVEQTEKAMATVGEKISGFSDDVRETLPQSGTLGSAAGAIADGLKSSGEYLQTHGFEDMSKDVTSVIRSHPMPAVWIGVGIGFILGQALVRR